MARTHQSIFDTAHRARGGSFEAVASRR
jgi:hypothetical protein